MALSRTLGHQGQGSVAKRGLKGLVVGVPKETLPGEESGHDSIVDCEVDQERSHCEDSGGCGFGVYSDAQYKEAGAETVKGADAFKAEMV